MPPRSARAWTQRRAAEEAVAAHRARVEQARREADYLRHAVEELTRLKPETGEETALAEKRATMMQVDKVAEDLRDAHEAVAGRTLADAGAVGRAAAARAAARPGAGADRSAREGARCGAHCARRRARRISTRR